MSHEYSLILLLAMAAVAVLTGHVGLGWLAQARRQATLSQGWKAQLLAAGTLASGASATGLLGLTNEVVQHPVGYGAVAAPMLWLGAVILCLPLTAALARTRSGWAVLLGTVLLTAAAAAVQMGWIWAAGFRPGVQWNFRVVGAGCALMLAGFAVALWVAGTIRSSRSTQEPQTFLRVGSAVVLGLSLLAGQQIVLGAADLDGQRGSVYRNQVPGSLLALACGALVPLTLAVMTLDLALRRRKRRERHLSGYTPQKRRKRRHRVRTL